MDFRCIVKEIADKSATVQFMKENMHFGDIGDDIMSRLHLNMLRSFADFERSLTALRALQGFVQ